MKIDSRLTSVVLLALVLGGALLWTSRASAANDGHMTMREWFQMMDARFASMEAASPEERPEEEEGTGFEPYQRFKWFMQRRLGDQEDLAPGVRWEAWKQLRQMEEQYGTGSQTWFSLGPINVAGRCLAVEIDPTNSNIAYAGFADGGIWKTIDAGATWTPLGDLLPTLAVSAIEIDQNNPNRVWIGTGEGWGNIDAVHGVGVLVSNDAGATWSLTGYSYAMSTTRDVFELEYNPATGSLFVGADNGLWRSTDGGATFTQVMTNGFWRDVELQHGSSTNLFGCTSNGTDPGFYRSFDDGLTWTLTTAGTPTVDLGNMRFGITAADPDIVYWAISGVSGNQKGIWKSTDAGASFTQIFFGTTHYSNQGWYNLTIDVDPTNASIVYSGGVQFYRSTNGAVSFSQQGAGVHVDHHATAWSLSNPSHFWVGSDGGVWRSTNSGVSFTGRNAALTTLQFYAINQAETLPTRALGGTQDNGTYQYDNSLSWDHVIGADGFFCEVDRLNPDIEYGEVYYGDHRRSMDGGLNFVSINNGISQQGPWSTPTWMDFSNPAWLWTAHNTRMFKSTDRGNNWTQVAGLSYTQGGVNIHQCRDHPEVMGLVTGSRVWVSTNHGASWTGSTGFSTLGLSDIAVDPHNPNIMVITQATYDPAIATVRKTTDQGLSWTPIDIGLPDEPANSIEIDPQHPNWYFLGTDLGVYVSFDAGANWVPFNTGLPHVVVVDLRLHDSARLLRAGTHGRGMWEADISGLDATAGVHGHPTVEPLGLRILGNPAPEVTTLRYGIREAGQVHLALYDANGRLVKTLVDGFQYPIMGSVDVSVKDLPPGVYFARLDANGATTSQKLIVQR